MNDKIASLLEHYNYENPGVRAGLVRLLNQGALAGTGKLVILPVDQGFEHGPDKSFMENEDAYDPCYHASLALEAGLSAFASSLGMIEAVAHKYAGYLPLILKLNHNNSLVSEDMEPTQGVVATVESAVRLGCVGVGYTIYPGSDDFNVMAEELRSIVNEAKAHGLVVVVWSYPRGGDLLRNEETALDVISYGAHIAASLGAHIIKVKLPSSVVYDDSIRAKYFFKYGASYQDDLATRVEIVRRACFAGKRLVVFSGGGKRTDSELYDEIKAINRGGGTGSIIGRNAFQRNRKDALAMFKKITDIYASEGLR